MDGVEGCHWGLLVVGSEIEGSALDQQGGFVVWRCALQGAESGSGVIPGARLHVPVAGVAITHLALAQSLSQSGQRPSLVVAY